MMPDAKNILKDDKFLSRYHWYTEKGNWAAQKTKICKRYNYQKKTKKKNNATKPLIKYAEYKEHELNKWGKRTGKALDKHAVSLYSTGTSQVVKTGDVKKLKQDIENDPIIRDQMANLGCILR